MSDLKTLKALGQEFDSLQELARKRGGELYHRDRMHPLCFYVQFLGIYPLAAVHQQFLKDFGTYDPGKPLHKQWTIENLITVLPKYISALEAALQVSPPSPADLATDTSANDDVWVADFSPDADIPI